MSIGGTRSGLSFGNERAIRQVRLREWTRVSSLRDWIILICTRDLRPGLSHSTPAGLAFGGFNLRLLLENGVNTILQGTPDSAQDDKNTFGHSRFSLSS